MTAMTTAFALNIRIFVPGNVHIIALNREDAYPKPASVRAVILVSPAIAEL
jgi:hypothetical protein